MKKKKLKPADKKSIHHIAYLTECDGEVGYFNAWTQEEIDKYIKRYQLDNYIVIKGGSVIKSRL